MWGTGQPRREFMHVDDLADAVYFLINTIEAKEIYNQGITHLNVGTGKDITIKESAVNIKTIVGYEGKIRYDKNNPDGTQRKLLDVSRLNRLGWQRKIILDDGIKNTYERLLKNNIF